jgi:hypothetical protein
MIELYFFGSNNWNFWTLLAICTWWSLFTCS